MTSIITIDTLIENLLPIIEEESDEPNTISNYNNDNDLSLSSEVYGLKKYNVPELKLLLKDYFDPKTLRKKLKNELIKDILTLKIPFEPKF